MNYEKNYTNEKTEPVKQLVTFDELERQVKEWFLVEDKGIIRLVLASVISYSLPGDPVWLFIIAPPSGLKTELIRALEKSPNVHPLSSLTQHTLISGQKRYGKETSLLNKIRNGILTFKDFTTILGMNYTAREEILSQLREVYDGKYSKSFGTGEDINWEGKIGFISGVTDVLDLHQAMHNILGERFLQYRMLQPDRREAAKRGMANISKIEQIRMQMKELFADYLQNIATPEASPEIPEEWQREIIELSDFATLTRGTIIRDPKTREITDRFPPEMPIRFAKQIMRLAQSFILIGGQPEDKYILRKVAFSSTSNNRRRVLWLLAKDRGRISLEDKTTLDEGEGDETDSEEAWTSKSIGIAMSLPSTTARRILEELNVLGLVERSGKSGKADIWLLKEEYRKFFEQYYGDEVYFGDELQLSRKI